MFKSNVGSCPVCGAPLNNGECGYCGYKAKKDVVKEEKKEVIQHVIINNYNYYGNKAEFDLKKSETEEEKVSKKSKKREVTKVIEVPRKNKWLLLILDLIFGWCGMHCVYAGKPLKALIYVVLLGAGLFINKIFYMILIVIWVLSLVAAFMGWYSDGEGKQIA